MYWLGHIAQFPEKNGLRSVARETGTGKGVLGKTM